MHARRKLQIAGWISIAVVIVCLALPLIASGSSPVPLLVGLLALAAAVAIPILLGRRKLILVAVWLAAYVIVYGALSYHGGYIDGHFGGSDNRKIWYPAYCGVAYWSRSGRQKCSLRPLAWFFLPLVIVDRMTIHRTHFDAY